MRLTIQLPSRRNLENHLKVEILLKSVPAGVMVLTRVALAPEEVVSTEVVSVLEEVESTGVVPMLEEVVSTGAVSVLEEVVSVLEVVLQLVSSCSVILQWCM